MQPTPILFVGSFARWVVQRLVLEEMVEAGDGVPGGQDSRSKFGI